MAYSLQQHINDWSLSVCKSVVADLKRGYLGNTLSQWEGLKKEHRRLFRAYSPAKQAEANQAVLGYIEDNLSTADYQLYTLASSTFNQFAQQVMAATGKPAS